MGPGRSRGASSGPSVNWSFEAESLDVEINYNLRRETADHGSTTSNMIEDRPGRRIRSGPLIPRSSGVITECLLPA
jgi:hypothetical protein